MIRQNNRLKEVVSRLSLVLAFAFALHLPMANADALPEGVFTPSSDSSLQDRWNGYNDPKNINLNYLRNFNALPLVGSLDSGASPWSETYWPSRRGGIAYRWNSSSPRGFGYYLSSRQQVASMSWNQKAALSPAEKYDILVGNYSYPTVHAVWNSTSPNNPSWWGICDGWATSAILYSEPSPKTVVNPHGIQVPFGSSDIKALMAYYYAKHADSRVYFLGTRCNSSSTGSPACNDTHAGAFHIVLANQIGVMKTAFIADHYRTYQVWNNPVYRFQSRIISRGGPVSGSAPGTVERVLIRSTVTYANEISYPRWNPVGTYSVTIDYRYWLELSGTGEIIGGTWYSWERPDFLWTRNTDSFSGYFSKIYDLL